MGARRFTALDNFPAPASRPERAKYLHAGARDKKLDNLDRWSRGLPPRGAGRRRHVTFTEVFVIGSVVTLGGALLLAMDGHPAAAGALILASPFPCPPGMPC